MDNETLLLFFTGDKGVLCATRLKWPFIKLFSNIYDYMLNYFEDLSEQDKPIEVLYRIINDIKEIPTCPVCGKPCQFERWDRGYKEFCSIECRRSKKGEYIVNQHSEKTFMQKYGTKRASMNLEVKEKMIKTNLERWGGNSPTNNKTISEKQIETKRKKYGEHLEILVETIKHTSIEKTGYDWPSKNPEVIEQMKETTIDKYGAFFNPEKSKLTCLLKYNVDYYAASDDCKEKRENSLMSHFGVTVPLQSKEILDKQKSTMLAKYGYDHNFKSPKLIDFLKSKEIRDRQWESKKKNGTTNTSKIEKQFEQYLIDTGFQYKREFNKDPRYPWHVDFYIPIYDLFIEILGAWTHGGHPYNENDENDKIILNNWMAKGQEICKSTGKPFSFYHSAIKVWTQRDVEKRNTALKNNLNYLEIFSCDLLKCINSFNNYTDKYKK